MVAISQIFATSVLVGCAVQALPQRQAETGRDDPGALFRDLLAAPTTVKRFQRLLGNGETILTGDALKKLVVFPFTPPASAPNANGGASKAAVRPEATLRVLTNIFGEHRDFPYLSWSRN